jgi:thioredoxin-like negative regulator of GroEL
MSHHITHIESRGAFANLLSNNPGMIILKFGADWCGPCKRIEKDVNHFFSCLPQDGSVIYGEIDIDESIDVYAYLKSNKRVNGIPVILCYVRGQSNGIIPTFSITGADHAELGRFFAKCMACLH